ncbi:MAG: hypothetical protein U0J70_07460, partial [Atopobiaceae bacterium]|nr:hypothetical protein [Atopobiaceae bacterium]
MDDKRSGGIVAAVSLTMMAAFVAIALLIIHTSVIFATQYAENMADMYASELLSELRLVTHGQDSADMPSSKKLLEVIQGFWDDTPPSTIFFDDEGKVMLSSVREIAPGNN